MGPVNLDPMCQFLVGPAMFPVDGSGVVFDTFGERSEVLNEEIMGDIAWGNIKVLGKTQIGRAHV